MSPKQVMTNVDFDRILGLIERTPSDEAIVKIWEEKLNRVSVIDQRVTPPDLITIHSTFKVKHLTHAVGPESMSLVYPHEASIEDGKISILAPLGVAILGHRVGETISWQGRDGHLRKITINSLTYQPESSGDWHL